MEWSEKQKKDFDELCTRQVSNYIKKIKESKNLEESHQYWKELVGFALEHILWYEKIKGVKKP